MLSRRDTLVLTFPLPVRPTGRNDLNSATAKYDEKHTNADAFARLHLKRDVMQDFGTILQE